MRTLIHVDMDAFFASVEQRDDPALQGRPVLVGGASERGVVAAASYEARPYGVRSAMPMVQALRLCPDAIVVPGHHERYSEVSRSVFDIFRRYTPLVEGLSIDEAFLDVTGSRQLFGDGRTIAQRIREEIEAQTDLTASAGVAPNKFVAKIASDANKPNGLTVVEPSEVESFLAPLPIRRMWGVGPKAAKRLGELGFRTFADLQSASEMLLVRELGSWGRVVKLLSRGEDKRPVVVDRETKSVSAEQTFEHDLVVPAAIRRVLLAQSDRVAARLQAADLSGRTITVKIKYANFQVRTRQTSLSERVRDVTTIYETTCALLTKFSDLRRGVRLVGVGVSSFSDSSHQHDLFESHDATDLQKRNAVQAAVGAVRTRFGHDAITRAALQASFKRDSD